MLLAFIWHSRVHPIYRTICFKSMESKSDSEQNLSPKCQNQKGPLGFSILEVLQVGVFGLAAAVAPGTVLEMHVSRPH